MDGEVRDLVVSQGELPDDLDGTLFRIGANLHYAPLSGRYNGWMGDGMVQRCSTTRTTLATLRMSTRPICGSRSLGRPIRPRFRAPAAWPTREAR